MAVKLMTRTQDGDDGVANLAAAAGHHVDHARGDANFDQQLDEPQQQAGVSDAGL